jgi:hypothetical protein
MNAWNVEHQRRRTTAMLLSSCRAGAHALAAASEKGMNCVALQQQLKQDKCMIAGNALWRGLTLATINQQCLSAVISAEIGSGTYLAAGPLTTWHARMARFSPSPAQTSALGNRPALPVRKHSTQHDTKLHHKRWCMQPTHTQVAPIQGYGLLPNTMRTADQRRKLQSTHALQRLTQSLGACRCTL